MTLYALRWAGWLALLLGWAGQCPAQRPTLSVLPPVPPALLATVLAARTPLARQDALLDIAHYYAAHGDTTASFRYVRAAIVAARANHNNAQLANAYQAFTNTYFNLGLLPAALRWGQLALPLWGENPGRAVTQNTLGLIYVKQGRSVEALQMLNAAYRTSAAAHNVRGQRLADNCRGALYLGADMQDSASFYLVRAATGFHKLPPTQQDQDNSRQESSALYNLGVLAFRRKDYRAASTYTRQALALRTTHGDSIRIPSTLNNLTKVDLATDSLPQALRYSQQSARMSTRLHLLDAQIVAWDNAGTSYSRLHQPDSADNCYRRALALAGRGGMRSFRARVLQSMALHNERSQRPAEAQRRAQEVAAVDSTLRDPTTTLDNLKLLGRLALARHDDAAALAYFQRQRTLELRQATAASSQQIAALRVGFDAERTEQQLAMATARSTAEAQRAEAQTQRAAAEAQRATTLRLLGQQHDAAYRDTLSRRERQRLAEELRAEQQTCEVEQASKQVQMLTQRTQLQTQQARLQAQQLELTRLRTRQERVGIGGLALLALLAGGGLFWQYRRRQAQGQAAREAALRTRLAADLHDDVGNLLTQINMQSGLLSEQHGYTPAQLVTRLDTLAATARRASQQMTDVVWGLNGIHQTLADLLLHMRDHAQEVLTPAEIDVEFITAPDLDQATPTAEVRHQLYLIFKEALHNVVKHAGATHVTVRLRQATGQLLLQVQDDGRGHTGTLRPGGNGLTNMQARAQAVGGAVTYEKLAPGFEVGVTMPGGGS